MIRSYLVINNVLIKQSLRLYTNQCSAKFGKGNENWNDAQPFNKIPRPSPFSFIMSFLPGGKFSKKPINEMMEVLHGQYGNIMKMPGMPGKPDTVVSFNPEDYEKIFRTEGIWPNRKGFDSLDYYRKKVRPDIFEKFPGLLTVQGKEWGDFRSMVNPMMMQPKTVRLYVPIINEVSNDFVKRIQKIRNPNTLETPSNFEEEINQWALEAIGAIALDTRLGLIGDLEPNSDGHKLIEALKAFFILLLELDFKPSLWKYIETKDLRKFIKVMDTITEVCGNYIREGEKRLQSNLTRPDHEASVLQKLLKINPNAAHVMAMEMLFSGVDTTSATFIYTLYLLAKNPEKQKLLQEEILNILPKKDTEITAEHLNRIPYLRGCIKESLRIFPVFNGTMRATGEDLVLSGYRVPKGTDVVIASVVLQKQESVYPEASKFIPERWLKESSGKPVHPFSFIPFGFGPRMCIGRRFAELEIEILLMKILRNFSVEWNQPDLKVRSSTINVPVNKLLFKFTDNLK